MEPQMGPQIAMLMLTMGWLALSAWLGYWIGSQRGRGGAGALLGLCLGPLGWLIAAVLPTTAALEARRQHDIAAWLERKSESPRSK